MKYKYQMCIECYSHVSRVGGKLRKICSPFKNICGLIKCLQPVQMLCIIQ